MSSEEDWSIISSLSDLDEDQATIDSQNDDIPASDSANVSSIATLKIPVLESGSSLKARSDSGSSDATIQRGAIGAIKGADSADDTVTEVSLEGAEEEQGNVTTDSAEDESGLAEPHSALSPSRIQSTIEYYETIAKEFRTGLTSSFRKHFRSKDNVREDDERILEPDSSLSALTPEPVYHPEDTEDVANVDLYFQQKVDQALTELNNSQAGKNIIFFVSLLTIIVGTFALVYLSSLLFVSAVSHVSNAWSPPVVTPPLTTSPYSAIWNLVWKAPPPKPVPESSIFSFLWAPQSPVPPAAPTTLLEYLREDVDQVFQSLDKSAVAIYETLNGGLRRLSDKLLKDYDREYFQHLLEVIDEHFQVFGEAAARYSKVLSKKSVAFELQLRSNSMIIAQRLHRYSVGLSKQLTQGTVETADFLAEHSIHWGGKLKKYSKLYSKHFQNASKTSMVTLSKNYKSLSKEFAVQTHIWSKLLWQHSINTSQQGLKFGSAWYKKFTEYTTNVQEFIADDDGFVKDILKNAAIQGKRINKAVFSMI